MGEPVGTPGGLHDALVARLRAAGCVFAEDEARLLLAEAASDAELEAMVARRVAGEPLETVLGWAEFCGLRVAVRPGVFVPRRRTELLVETALELRPDARVVIDLCCGTGAVGLALSHALSDIELHAADVDPAATACAAVNLAGRGEVHTGDLYDALPVRLCGRVDVLAANVPYVPTVAIAGMPPEARDHEARIALDGGPDGLAVFRRVADRAADWLAPAGVLLSETSAVQAPTALQVLDAAGLEPRRVSDEERGATVVYGVSAGRRSARGGGSPRR